METITLHTRDVNVALAARPVTRQEFKAYLAANDRPVPAPLAHGDSGTSPVIEVSQVDAADYCRWFGAQQGRSYRLPTMAELHELADEITQEGVNPEVWPHTHQLHPEVRGGMKPTYLCEWTQETEELPQLGGRRAGPQFGQHLLSAVGAPGEQRLARPGLSGRHRGLLVRHVSARLRAVGATLGATGRGATPCGRLPQGAGAEPSPAAGCLSLFASPAASFSPRFPKGIRSRSEPPRPLSRSTACCESPDSDSDPTLIPLAWIA